jgi:hypothetical protein
MTSNGGTEVPSWRPLLTPPVAKLQHSEISNFAGLKTPKKAAFACAFCFTIQPDCHEAVFGNFFRQSLTQSPSGRAAAGPKLKR